MFVTRSSLRVFSLSICAGLILFLAGSQAGMAQNETKGNEAMTQAKEGAKSEATSMQSMMMRMQEISKELKSIQQEVLKDSPELKKQQDELDSFIQEQMDANMADKGVDMEALKSLQSRLRSKDVNPEKKQELESEWKEKVNAYQQARMETMRNEEVQSKRKTYRDDLVAAMTKKEPQTEEMLDELKMLQHQMQYRKQSAMQKRKAAQEGASKQGKGMEKSE